MIEQEDRRKRGALMLSFGIVTIAVLVFHTLLQVVYLREELNVLRTSSLAGAQRITLSKWEPIVEVTSNHTIKMSTNSGEVLVYACSAPIISSRDALNGASFYVERKK